MGIDLGTSSVKLCLMDSAGVIQASVKAEYPTLGADDGFFEQDPHDWVMAIKNAMARINAACPGVEKNIKAAALSAQMPTLVLATPDGTVLRRAITWRDSRAEAQGKALLEQWGVEKHYSRTGIVLDGRYLLPMYKWTLENENFDTARPHLILSARDWLALWLTGEVSTDPSTASGSGIYNLTTGEYDTELLAEAGFGSELLPPIMPSDVPCGTLTDGAAKLLGLPVGIPIIAGAADSVCGVFGTGASQPGDVCQIWGSSTAVVAVTGEPVFSPLRRFFITPLAKTGTFGVEADILSTGTALDWLAGIFGDINEEFYGGRKDDAPVSAVSKIARKACAGAGGLLFYPFFSSGEQGVLWDTTVSATMTGLSVSHRLPELARALLEGMCYEARRCLTAFYEAGCVPRVIRCAGACADDVFFMQLLADITDLPVDALLEKNASAAGAALLAGIETGMWRYEDVPALPVCRSVSYMPDGSVQTLYGEGYKHYALNTSRARQIRGG